MKREICPPRLPLGLGVLSGSPFTTAVADIVKITVRSDLTFSSRIAGRSCFGEPQAEEKWDLTGISRYLEFRDECRFE